MAYSQSFIDEQKANGGRLFNLIKIEFAGGEINLVDNIEDVIFNGTTYTATALRVTLPTQPKSGIPTSTISLDHVGSQVSQIIEDNDGIQQATVTISQVMMSEPDTEQFAITLKLTNITVNCSTVSATLGFDQIYNQPAFHKYYDADNAPALV